MSTLYVLDGTAMLFRSYFAKFRLTGPDGVEVGALLGLGQAFARFVREVRPPHLAVVFDAGRKTFRNDLYPAYKANRGDPPDDLVPQFPLAPSTVAALGAVHLMEVGWEADDLMATLATWGNEAGLEVVLVTSDKDICQLVRPGVRQMDPKSYVEFDVEAITTRFGLRPDQLVDLQALCGDSVDNVPGVRGVGPKAATALLDAFDTLDGIYANLDKVPDLPVRGAKGLQVKLEAARDEVGTFRELVRLRDDVPSEALGALAPADLAWNGPAADADAFFDQVGFHQPLRLLRGL